MGFCWQLKKEKNLIFFCIIFHYFSMTIQSITICFSILTHFCCLRYNQNVFLQHCIFKIQKIPFFKSMTCPPNRKCLKNLLYYLKFTYILCFSKIKLKTFWSRTSLSLVVINGIHMINRHICKTCQTVGSKSSLAFSTEPL